MTVMLGEARGMVTLDISDLSSKVGLATAQLNSLDAAGSKGMGGFQNELARTGVSVDQLGYGLLGLGGALLAPMALGVKGAINLEQAFKDVEASLPKDDRGRMGELESMIVKIGASGQYSAGEIAMVTEELAKSGYEIDQILSGDPAEGFGNMAQAVSDLSSATGSGLGPAVSGISAAMAIWNPKVVDSSIALTDASRAADIFTVAANASSADVSDIIAGMRNFGPAAAMVGVSFEDAAASVALFTNFGLKATDAGTSLTRAVTMLSDPTSEASGWMEKLAIAPFKDGKFIGLPALMDQLQAGMAGMSDETKLAALSSIFGAEAMDVMGLSIMTGGDALRDITKEMAIHGTASEQARLRTETLKGAIERLVEGFMTMLAVLASGLIGPLTAFAKALDVVTSAIMKIPKPILAVVGVLITLAGVLATGAGAFLLITPRITQFLTTMRALSGMSGVLGGLASGFLRMGGAAGFLAGALRMLLLPLGLVFGAAILAYKNNFLGFADLVNEKVGMIKGAWETVTGLFDAPVSSKARQEFEDFAGDIQSIAGSGADGLDWFVLGPDGEKLGDIISSVNKDGVITMEVRDPEGNMRTLVQNADGTTQWVVDVEVNETEAMGRIERVNKGLEGLKDILSRKGLGLFNPLITGAQKSLIGLGKLGGGFDRLTGWWGRFKSDFAGTRGIPGMDFMDRIQSAWRTSTMFDNPLGDWAKALGRNVSGAWNAIADGARKIPFVGDTIGNVMDKVGGKVRTFTDGLSRAWRNTGDLNLFQRGIASLSEGVRALGFDSAARKIAQFGGAVTGFVDGFRAAWKNTGDLNLWERGIASLSSGLQRAGFDGAARKVARFGRAVGSAFGAVTGKVGDVVDSFQFLRKMGYGPLEAATESLGYHFPLLGRAFDLVGAGVSGVRGVFRNIANTISGGLNKALDTGKTFVDEFRFAWEIADKTAGPFAGRMSTTEKAAFALGEAFKAVGLEDFGQGIQDLSDRLHEAWGEDGVAGLLREIPVVGGAAATTFETLQGWGQTAAKGIGWAWGELKNDFFQLTSEGMNPVQAGFVALGELGMDVAGRIGGALSDLAASIGGWALDVGIPTLAGWITTFLEDPWGAIQGLWGSIGSFRANIRDWYIDLAEPNLQSAIVSFDDWLSGKLGIQPPLRTKIAEWIATVAAPTLEKGAWEFTTLIIDLIGAAVVTIGANVWSLMMGKPTIVLGFDINEAFEDAVGNTVLWTADVLATLALKIENDPFSALKVTLLAAGATMLAGLFITGGIGAVITLGVLLGLGALAVAVFNAVRNFFSEDDGARMKELKLRIGTIWGVLEGIPIVGKLFWAVGLFAKGVAAVVGALIDFRNGLIDIGGPAEAAVRTFEALYLGIGAVLGIMKLGGWGKAATQISPLVQQIMDVTGMKPAAVIKGPQAFLHGLERIAKFPFRLIFKPLDTLRDMFGVTGRAAQTGSQSFSLFSKRTGINFRLIGNIIRTTAGATKAVLGTFFDPLLWSFRKLIGARIAAGFGKFVAFMNTDVVNAFRAPLRHIFGYTERIDKAGKVTDRFLHIFGRGKRMGPFIDELDTTVRRVDGLVAHLRTGLPRVFPAMIEGVQNFGRAVAGGFANFARGVIGFEQVLRKVTTTTGKVLKSLFTGDWIRNPFMDDTVGIVGDAARYFGRFDDVLRGAVLPMQRFMDDGTRIFGPFMDELRPMGPMLDDLAPAANRFRQAFTSFGDNVLRVAKGAGGGIRGFFGSFGDELAKGVKNAGGLRQLATFIGNLGPMGKIAAAGIGLLTGTALFKGGVLDGVIGGVQNVGSALSGAWNAISNSFKAGGVAGVLDLLITQMGAFFTSLPGKLAGFLRNADWGSISTALLTILSLVLMGPWGLAIGALAPFLGPIIGDAIGGIVDIFDSFLTGGFDEGFKTLRKVTRNGVRQVGRGIEQLGDFMLDVAKPISRIPIIGKPMAAALTWMGNGLQGFGQHLQAVAPKIADFVENVGRNLVAGVQKAWSAITNQMGPAFTNLVGAIGDLLGPLKDIGSGFMDLIRGDFIDGLKGIGGGFKDLGLGVLDVGTAWTGFVASGIEGVGKLGESLMDNLADRFPTLSGAFSEFGDVFSSGFAVFGNLARAAGALMQGDFAGAFGFVQDAASSAWDAISSGISGIGDLIGAINWTDLMQRGMDVLKDVGNWMLEKIQQGGDIASQVGQWAYDKIKNIPWSTWFGLALSSLVNIGSWIMDKIRAGIDFVTDLGTWFGEKFQAVKWEEIGKAALDALSSLSEWILAKIQAGSDLAQMLFGWFAGKLLDVQWGEVAKGALDLLSGVSGWILEKIQSGADLVGLLFGWFAGKLLEVNWKGIFEGAVALLADAGQWIYDLFAGFDLGDKLRAWASAAFGKIIEAAAPMINDFIALINTLGAAYNQIAGILGLPLYSPIAPIVADWQMFADVLSNDVVNSAETARGKVAEMRAEAAAQAAEQLENERKVVSAMRRVQGGVQGVINVLKGLPADGVIPEVVPVPSPTTPETPTATPTPQGLRDMPTIFDEIGRKAGVAAAAVLPLNQHVRAISQLASPVQLFGKNAGTAFYDTGLAALKGLVPITPAASQMAAQLIAAAPSFTQVQAAALAGLTPIGGYAQTMSAGIKGSAIPAFVATQASAASNFPLISSIAATNFGQLYTTVSSRTGDASSSATRNTNTMSSNVGSATKGMSGDVTSYMSTMAANAASRASSMNTGVSGQSRSMSTTTLGTIGSMRSGAEGHFGNMASTAGSRAGEMASRMTSGASQARSGVQGQIGQVPGIISSIGGAAAGVAFSVGANISSAMASGMRSALGAIQAAAAAMVSAAETALRAKAMISSPSRLFLSLGKYLGEGLVKGVRATFPQIAAAIKAMIAEREINRAYARMQQQLSTSLPVPIFGKMQTISSSLKAFQGDNTPKPIVDAALALDSIAASVAKGGWTPDLMAMVDRIILSLKAFQGDNTPKPIVDAALALEAIVQKERAMQAFLDRERQRKAYAEMEAARLAAANRATAGGTTTVNTYTTIYALKSEDWVRTVENAEAGARHAEEWEQPRALSQYIAQRG